MRTVGIIAEYNPFHNGHAYQIRKAKELTNANYCVVVMSGDFVQRGAPALMDKYLRTECALRNGADLILELPVCFALSSAEKNVTIEKNDKKWVLNAHMQLEESAVKLVPTATAPVLPSDESEEEQAQ